MTENTEGAVRTATLFIDQIDDETATLLLGERAFTVPTALLPANAREGEWLLCRMARTAGPSGDSTGRRERLGKDDPGGDIKL